MYVNKYLIWQTKYILNRKEKTQKEVAQSAYRALNIQKRDCQSYKLGKTLERNTN